jgi:hypothetical protein
MAQLAASIISHDDGFQAGDGAPAPRRPACRSASSRSGAASAVSADLSSLSTSGPISRPGWPTIERLRAASRRRCPSLPWQPTSEPELILQAMRAGANEFFPWRFGGGIAGARTDGGVVPRRSAIRKRPHGARRRARAAAQPCVTHVFFGAKGGAGTTTVAVNCAVELARAHEAADGHRRPEALPRGGRALPRRPPAVHGARRDREPAPPRQGLPARADVAHKSGLDILAGSEQFDRPNAQDAGAIEELLRCSPSSTTTSSWTPAT